MRAWLLLALVLAAVLGPSVAASGLVLFREDFSTLDNWKPFYFPKIERHSEYAIESHGTRHWLRTESHTSASAIVYRSAFNPRDYPHIRWRWKVANVYAKGNARTREGDDYPIRVFVMFEYDPETAGLFERLQFGLLKKIYGEYPPASSLSYVWANRADPARIVTSPFTDRAKQVLLEQGAEKIGTWQDEEAYIVDDYRKAFGGDLPKRARIAIMNDSDNTGESSVSWIEYIEVSD